MIAAVVCVDNNYGIGSKNNLLAHIPEDMKMFKEITTGGAVVVGRKTYDSLPKKPLPDRTNIVVTSKVKRKPKNKKDGTIHSNMNYIKAWLIHPEVVNENCGIYVIGGGMIYKELLPLCERVYITKVLHSYEDVDTYFPNIDEMPEWEMTSCSEIKEYNGIQYQFCIYDRVDYEILSATTPDNPENKLDMVVTVRAFNGLKTVILRMEDNKHLNAYVDSWEYLHDERNMMKFLNRVKDFKEKEV